MIRVGEGHPGRGARVEGGTLRSPGTAESRRPRVAIVDLGRDAALGAVRRVSCWRRLWERAGADVDVISLVTSYPASAREAVLTLARGLHDPAVVPEGAVWSQRRLREQLDRLGLDVVVFTTARSYHPAAVPTGATVVLDYVDRLSDNYRQRARLVGPARSVGYQVLAHRMRRFERLRPAGLRRTAAGWGDAQRLDAEWVPNVVEPASWSRDRQPDVDVLFLGTLSYVPNVRALHRLERAWPRLRERRPTASLLVAGANPGRELRGLVERAGWHLVANFSSLEQVCSRARVAVAPLAQATGIQNKVLEAAAHGLPQVVDPAVLLGVGPGFPALTARSDDELVDGLDRLLGRPREAEALGSAARAFVAENFSVDRWAGWCRSLVAS